MTSIDKFISRQAAKGPSACLMLLPDEPSMAKVNELKHGLTLPPGTMLPDDGEKGPHVTIRFWETDGTPLGQPLKDFLAEHLDGMSVDAMTTAWSILGKKHDTLVLTVESPELMGLQKKLDQTLQKRYGVPPSDFDEYRPHISVAEGLTGKEKLPNQSPRMYLHFNQWSLTEGKDGEYDEVWSLRAAKWIKIQ